MNASDKPVRIGVDIGGTFTDLQIFDTRNSRIVAHKLPTTPEDPSIALVEGIKAAGRRYGFTLSDVGYLITAPPLPPMPCLNASCRRAR